jgi:hypothetical protein
MYKGMKDAMYNGIKEDLVKIGFIQKTFQNLEIGKWMDLKIMKRMNE